MAHSLSRTNLTPVSHPQTCCILHRNNNKSWSLSLFTRTIPQSDIERYRTFAAADRLPGARCSPSFQNPPRFAVKLTCCSPYLVWSVTSFISETSHKITHQSFFCHRCNVSAMMTSQGQNFLTRAVPAALHRPPRPSYLLSNERVPSSEAAGLPKYALHSTRCLQRWPTHCRGTIAS